MAQCAIGGEAGRHVGRIRGPSEIRLVAAVAIGWQRGVVVIRMARSAGNGSMCTRQRERRGVVIKCRSGPVSSRVTSGTRGREASSNVIGIGCPGKIRFVASIAVGGHSRVVVIGMTCCAGDSRVRAGQRERRVVVVEGRRRPRRCVMAGRAGGGETGCHVIGVVSPGKVRLMARIAIGWNRRVVVIRMTLRARDGDMCAGQWKRRSRVVEGRSSPGRRVVAGGARRGKAGSYVGRTVGSGVVSLVAGIAIGRNRRVVVIRMALCASHGRMSPGQWKDRRVIKG